MEKETKTIFFKNYNKDGEVKKYEIVLDWSLYDLLNMHVYDENDNELFYKEVELQ